MPKTRYKTRYKTSKQTRGLTGPAAVCLLDKNIYLFFSVHGAGWVPGRSPGRIGGPNAMLAVLTDKTVSKLDTAHNIARLDHLKISRSGFTVRPGRSPVSMAGVQDRSCQSWGRRRSARPAAWPRVQRPGSFQLGEIRAPPGPVCLDTGAGHRAALEALRAVFLPGGFPAAAPSPGLCVP